MPRAAVLTNQPYHEVLSMVFRCPACAETIDVFEGFNDRKEFRCHECDQKLEIFVSVGVA